MMESGVLKTVEKIHSCKQVGVVAVTGGLGQSIAWLLGVPGASSTLLEATVPYSRESMMSYLNGEEPTEYVSKNTAMKIANASFKRASKLSDFGTDIFGVGASCSLVTLTPKRGEHRMWVAVQTLKDVKICGLRLQKGSRGRFDEDTLCSKVVLQTLAESVGVTSDISLGLQLATEKQTIKEELVRSTQLNGNPLEDLWAGNISCIEYAKGKVTIDAPRENLLILSGSFNPVHEGHISLLRAAADVSGSYKPCFEISISNADKSLPSMEEIKKRIQQFVDQNLPVVVTREPYFFNKAKLFRNSRFVVGIDTAERLVLCKYYENNKTKMLIAFEKLRSYGCEFVVAGRKVNDVYKQATDFQVDSSLLDMFTFVPENSFRVDISSSEIRTKMGGASSVVSSEVKDAVLTPTTATNKRSSVEREHEDSGIFASNKSKKNDVEEDQEIVHEHHQFSLG